MNVEGKIAPPHLRQLCYAQILFIIVMGSIVGVVEIQSDRAGDAAVAGDEL